LIRKHHPPLEYLIMQTKFFDLPSLSAVSSIRPLTLLAAAVVFLTSCNLPLEDQTQPPGDGKTVVAQTVQAKFAVQTGTALANQEEITDTPPAGGAETEEPGSSPTPSLTLTPTDAATPTPAPPGIHVTGDTFCRFGPGDVYDALGILNTDQESIILAEDPTGSFWFIQNPDNPGENCWVWGNYATPEGPTEQLPVYTPPPTPTPSASISASFVYVCAEWYFDFQVNNTGNVPFESYRLTLEDQRTGVTEVTQVNQWPGACTGGGPETLDPGSTGRAYAEFLDHNPLGDTIRATLKACQQDNLGGVCATTTWTFTASK
jgi:hypothetical protein